MTISDADCGNEFGVVTAVGLQLLRVAICCDCSPFHSEIRRAVSGPQASLTPSNCLWPRRAAAADQPQWTLPKANNGSWAAMGALTSMFD